LGSGRRRQLSQDRKDRKKDVTLMYELTKNWKIFTSKFVGTGPSSYEKRIYRAAVSQKLRNTGLGNR
jgi:hypothetical protein